MPGAHYPAATLALSDATLLECLDTVDAIRTDVRAVLEPRGNAYTGWCGQQLVIECDAPARHEESLGSSVTVWRELCERSGRPRVGVQARLAQRTHGIRRCGNPLDHPLSASIFAATMKSLRDRPLIACVVSATST
jgi:hypothetical protein